ncbi:hypothetical protein ABFS82_08G193200 [Erythranthe guttata]
MISLRCRPAVLKFNFGPVIGILGNATDASYIAAGARVIPLIYNEPLELRNEKLNLVNGVIFTAKSGVYFDVVKSIFEINVRRKNDAGHHFPLLAICLGFELLTMIVSEDENIMDKFNAKNHASNFKVMKKPDVNGNGSLFQRFPEVLRNKLSTKSLVMQNHSFRRDARLDSFFKILATSTDKNGKPYGSSTQISGDCCSVLSRGIISIKKNCLKMTKFGISGPEKCV